MKRNLNCLRHKINKGKSALKPRPFSRNWTKFKNRMTNCREKKPAWRKIRRSLKPNLGKHSLNWPRAMKTAAGSFGGESRSRQSWKRPANPSRLLQADKAKLETQDERTGSEVTVRVRKLLRQRLQRPRRQHVRLHRRLPRHRCPSATSAQGEFLPKIKRLNKLRQAITKNPKDIKSMIKMAQVAFGASRFQEAIEPLTKAVKLQPKDAELFFHAGGSALQSPALS